MVRILSIAKQGEAFAASHLDNHGFYCFQQNYRVGRRSGLQGELDWLGLSPDGTCVIAGEVKTRQQTTDESLHDTIERAAQAITLRKQQQMSLLLDYFLSSAVGLQYQDCETRLDALLVAISPEGVCHLHHIEGLSN